MHNKLCFCEINSALGSAPFLEPESSMWRGPTDPRASIYIVDLEVGLSSSAWALVTGVSEGAVKKLIIHSAGNILSRTSDDRLGANSANPGEFFMYLRSVI